MRKLMKDYGKGILAVLGVVLMLAFALPTVFTGQTDAGSIVAGKLAGKKIYLRAIQGAQTDLAVLDEFGMTWLLAYRQSPDGRGIMGIRLDDRDKPTHFYLLLTEAQKYGLYAGDEEVDDAIKEASEGGQPLTEDAIREHLGKLGLPVSSMREGIRHALMVRKLGAMALSATPITVPELENLADSALSQVVVDYAVLEANKNWEKAPEPTAAQLEKQFALYKDVEPLSSQPEGTVPPAIDGHKYPFGYKYPDRVEVEWLKFDAADIRAKFQPTEEDYEAAYEYYQSHPTEFVKRPEPATQAATQSATQAASAPATQPAATQTASTAPAIESFAEVKERLVADQIHQRAEKLIGRMVDRAVGMAAEPWKAAATDAQGFHEDLPHDKWLSYEAIAGDIAKNKDYNTYKPTYGKTTGWMDRGALVAMDGIGSAIYPTQREDFVFPDLALGVKELRGPAGLAGRLGLQVGVEGPVLVDTAGNRYVYRVSAAEPAHAAKSLDEKKGEITDDLKKLATYEARQADAKALAEQTAGMKADALVGVAKERGLDGRKSESFSRLGKQDHVVAEIPGMIDAAFALAEKAPAKAAGTQPGAASQPGTATTTLTDDAALRVYVMALENYKATTPAEFAQGRPFLYRERSFESQSEFMNDWSALEAVARRLDYLPTTPFPVKKSP